MVGIGRLGCGIRKDDLLTPTCPHTPLGLDVSVM